MFKTAWNMPGFWNKLSVFLKGPGWEPGKPRLGNLEDIPDVSSMRLSYGFVNFDKKQPRLQWLDSESFIAD